MEQLMVEDGAKQRSGPAGGLVRLPRLLGGASRDGLGDREFEQLYRASRDDVFAYVLTLVSERSVAEDVTAAAFERAYRKRRRYDPVRGEARAWIFGIARNAALDELRKRKPQQGLGDEDGETIGASADRRLEATEDRVTVRDALSMLGGADRELIALRYFADLPLAEIAGLLGVSESNAGTRLHRAVGRLRRAVEDGR